MIICLFITIASLKAERVIYKENFKTVGIVSTNCMKQQHTRGFSTAYSWSRSSARTSKLLHQRSTLGRYSLCTNGSSHSVFPTLHNMQQSHVMMRLYEKGSLYLLTTEKVTFSPTFMYNNTHDNVYSAVIMTTRSVREFTRFIWWIAEQRQAAVDPQTKPRANWWDSNHLPNIERLILDTTFVHSVPRSNITRYTMCW